MAVCLVPLTLLFIAFVTNAAHLPSMLHGPTRTREFLLYCLGSLVGPAGIVLAVRTIFCGARPIGRVTSAVLRLLALWTLIAFTGHLVHDHAVLTSWRELVLIALLPALAVCHLMRIDHERRALAATS